MKQREQTQNQTKSEAIQRNQRRWKVNDYKGCVVKNNKRQ